MTLQIKLTSQTSKEYFTQERTEILLISPQNFALNRPYVLAEWLKR
jgi:hypothetical protein